MSKCLFYFIFLFCLFKPQKKSIICDKKDLIYMDESSTVQLKTVTHFTTMAPYNHCLRHKVSFFTECDYR